MCGHRIHNDDAKFVSNDDQSSIIIIYLLDDDSSMLLMIHFELKWVDLSDRRWI